MKAYKYRAYPTKIQAIAIDAQIEYCRQLWNTLLAQKKNAYKKDKISLSRNDLNNRLKGEKMVHSQVSQNVSQRIVGAYTAFFGRVKRGEKEKGFPRFKTYKESGSITLPQIVNPKKIGKKTYFPKIGWLNTKYHRPIEGTPKTLTIKKSKSGKYFLTVCCDGVPKEVVEVGDGEAGIDLGLNHFIATSDGDFIEHPKPIKQLPGKRKALAKEFSKTKKRSKNRNKARIRQARTDEKIANIRNDFGWKTCLALIKKYKTIYMENLNVRGMAKNRFLAKAIADVSWSDFTSKLSFKAESAGVKVVKVNPKNTSQACSGCGNIVRKTLAMRTHRCPHCGLVLDRDINSARNILIKGIGLGRPKLTPVGVKASTDGISPKQALTMKQEAHCFGCR